MNEYDYSLMFNVDFRKCQLPYRALAMLIWQILFQHISRDFPRETFDGPGLENMENQTFKQNQEAKSP